MKKNTPTKKEPIKAHRGRIVYEGGGGRPRGGVGKPQIPRPIRGGRPRPFPFPRRPNPFGPPRGGRRRPRIDPRIMFGGPRRGLGGSSMAGQALRRAMAERQGQGIQTQRAAMGNKGMSVTKKAIGENDFRKGGLTLSTVNNLKKT
tara:strand:- start:1400 stop:1837 length:438 start_codon:yes stop_codon:yes gene_type:complete